MEDKVAPDAQASRKPPPPPSASPRATTSSYMSPSASADASASFPPTGHSLRRSMTFDGASPLRRRPTSMISVLSSEPGEAPTQSFRRRSSTPSDFSIAGFRDGTQEILNPSAAKHSASAQDGSSILSSLPLAFALLPAFFGALFEGGEAVITDVMLLVLVFVFLRYTILQPWQWYHETQEVRIRQEVGLDQIFEDVSEEGIPPKMSASMTTLDEVPEEESQDGEEDDHHSHEGRKPHAQPETTQSIEKQNRTRAQEAAVSELYVHEVLALLACFLSPILGAYLLHWIRAYLTRSEGLLADFNIIIFLMAAELRPISHALKLVQARTLHLQRVVQAVPLPRSTSVQLEEMRIRLAQLELRAENAEHATASALESARAVHQQQQEQQQQNGTAAGAANPPTNKDATVREVRNAIQPDIDAVTRAVRRYEKKVTIMAVQTAARLGNMDTRLDDAVALAAAAAKQHNSAQWGIVALAAWLVDWAVTIITMPYHLAMFVIMWPFRTIGHMLQGRRSSRDTRDGHGRSTRHSGLRGSRNGSGSERDRYRDRVPSRLSGRYSP